MKHLEKDDVLAIVGVYVDDIMVVGRSQSIMDQVLSQLQQMWQCMPPEVLREGESTVFLGAYRQDC